MTHSNIIPQPLLLDKIKHRIPQTKDDIKLATNLSTSFHVPYRCHQNMNPSSDQLAGSVEKKKAKHISINISYSRNPTVIHLDVTYRHQHDIQNQISSSQNI